YSRKIKKTLENRLMLKNRLEYTNVLSSEDQSTYYSSWMYSAVHILLSVPRLASKEKMRAYLGIPHRKLSEILDFLVRTGLAVHEGGQYAYGPSSLHLGNDSGLITKHHMNWRLQAMRSLEREAP